MPYGFAPLSDNERKHLQMTSAVEADGDAAAYGYLLHRRGDRPRLVRMAIQRCGVPVVLPMLDEDDIDMEWAALRPLLEAPLAPEMRRALSTVIEEHGGFTFLCPHCRAATRVDADMVNCTIFRHAVEKRTGKFVNPHATKSACDAWIRDGKVDGCGKPFRFDGKSPAQPCDYI